MIIIRPSIRNLKSCACNAEKLKYIMLIENFMYVEREADTYGLGVPEIESLLWRGFPHSSIRALGPILPPIQCVPANCRGGGW